MNIKNNSKLLYLQAQFQFERAMKKFEDGSIKREPHLIKTVFDSFQEFFTQMGKPNMIPRYVSEGGPPWSEDYNDMMDEIKSDLKTLFEELDILGKSLHADFNHNVMQNEIIHEEYTEVYDKLKDLETYVNLSDSDTLRFGRDDFLNDLKIDWDKISGRPLEIGPAGVSLPVKGEKRNVALSSKVTIVPGNQKHDDFILGADSNGFPGNNNEITMISDPLLTGTSGYQFVGRDNNRGNYGAVIDGNPNSWFEYERVGLRDHERLKVTKNLGWEYAIDEDRRIYFAEDPKDGVLKLHLQIVLSEEEIINEIDVEMYTPPNYGAQTAVIENILVSSEYGAPRSIIPKNKQDTDYTFQFEPMKAKVITIQFKQKHKYYTDLGHIYYEKRMDIRDSADYIFSAISYRERPEFAPRVDGPILNIEDLGVTLDVRETGVKTYYELRGSSDNQGYSLDDAVNSLLKQLTESNVDAGVERIEGHRYAIGIKNINIYSVEYEDKGELVTTPYYFDQPVDRVSISVNETLERLISKSSMIRYDWISYYVSVDDGKEWYPITPLEREARPDDPPKLYTIQQVFSENEAVFNRAGYIESPDPVYSLRLKIVIEKPYGFDLENSPEEELEDYSSSSLQKFSFQVETNTGVEDKNSIILDSERNEIDYEGIYRPSLGIDTTPSGEHQRETEDTPPSGTDGYIELEYDEISLDLRSYPVEIEACSPLVVRGVATSSVKIDSLELFINNVKVNPMDYGAPKPVDGCSTNQALINTIEPINQEGSQLEFQFSIPYWKIVELGSQVGDPVDIEIIATDMYEYDAFEFTTYIVSRKEGSGPRNLILETIVLQYYDEEESRLKTLELSKNILPYQFDNGEGTLVTIGWDKDTQSVNAMVTGGYNESGFAFQIYSIGIRYLDLSSNSQVKWASVVKGKSDGATNSNLILGGANLNKNKWLQDVEEGNYHTAPSLSKINDWIRVGFGSEWEELSEPINQTFKISDYLKDDSPPSYNESDEVKDCNVIEKVFLQYYDPIKEELFIHTVRTKRDYNPVKKLSGKNKDISLLVGWSDNYSGLVVSPTVMNKREELILVSVGVLYRDLRNILVTEWMEEVKLKTAFVQNEEKMNGKLKDITELGYIEEIQQGSIENAPALLQEDSAIIGKFSSYLSSQVCTTDLVDNHHKMPDMTDLPPEVFLNTNIDSVLFYQDYPDKKINLNGYLQDDKQIAKWSIVSTDFNVEEDVLGQDIRYLEFNQEVPLDFPERVSSTETYQPMIDIFFIVDTSNSGMLILDSLKHSMEAFIAEVDGSGADVRIGLITTATGEDQLRIENIPAANFDVSELKVNSNSPGSFNEGHLADNSYGVSSLFHKLREGSKRHVILVSSVPFDGVVPEYILNDFSSKNIQVSSIARTEGQFKVLAEELNGLSFKVNSSEIHEEASILSEMIVDESKFRPDSTQVINIEVQDSFGNKATRKEYLNFKDKSLN